MRHFRSVRRSQGNLAVSQADDPNLPHIGPVGDTYTTLLSGKATADRFCLIDMHVPPGGGPPPHRHDFEESFVVLEGEIETIFRGAKSVVTAGKTIHIPANAPHQFRNASEKPARLLCICSPAGQEEFFAQLRVLVATRTTAPPRLDEKAQAQFRAKAEALAPKIQNRVPATRLKIHFAASVKPPTVPPLTQPPHTGLFWRESELRNS